jgi:hypothetical protein
VVGSTKIGSNFTLSGLLLKGLFGGKNTLLPLGVNDTFTSVVSYQTFKK